MCICTVQKLMIFIKAFFNSQLLNDLNVRHRIQPSMFPIHYKEGYMRILLGGIGAIFMGKGKSSDIRAQPVPFTFIIQEESCFLLVI